jgi:hypothetical protein
MRAPEDTNIAPKWIVTSKPLRVAFGGPHGLRSATYRIWSNKKGDFYVAARALGSMFKASLHRDGRCHVGFTSDFASAKGIDNRHLNRWTVTLDHAARALDIFVTGADLTAVPDADDDESVVWISAPSSHQMSTLAIFTAPKALGPPPTGMPWDVVAELQTQNRCAFLLHVREELGDRMRHTLAVARESYAKERVRLGIPLDPDLRVFSSGVIDMPDGSLIPAITEFAPS